MGIVRKVYKADWRSLVVTAADIETPKGLVRVRFIYDKASGGFFHAIPGGVTFAALGLSRGKTNALLARAKKSCLWRVEAHEKARKDKQELAEFRQRERGRRSRKKNAPREQQEFPF